MPGFLMLQAGPFHFHDQPELMLVSAGTAVVSVDFHQYTLTVGDVLFSGAVLTGAKINPRKNPINEFEAYISLANLRNKVIHYKDFNFTDVYLGKIEREVSQAPQIIKDLFVKFVNMDKSQKYELPNWII